MANMDNNGQLNNIIRDIKAQINTFNPEELQRLKVYALGIAGSSGISPELKRDIESLINVISNKEESVQQHQVSQVEFSSQQTEKELEESKAEILRYNEAQVIYKEFDTMSQEYLEEQHTLHKSFKQIFDEAKAGREINEDLKKSMYTPEKVEKEREKWEKIEVTRAKAQEEKEHSTALISKIIQDIKGEVDSSILSILQVQREFHEERKKDAEKKLEEIVKHDKLLEARAKIQVEASKLEDQPLVNKNFFQEQERLFAMIYSKSSKQIVEEGAKRERIQEEKETKEIRDNLEKSPIDSKGEKNLSNSQKSINSSPEQSMRKKGIENFKNSNLNQITR